MLYFNVCLNMLNILLVHIFIPKCGHFQKLCIPPLCKCHQQQEYCISGLTFKGHCQVQEQAQLWRIFGVFFRSKSCYNLLYIKHLNTLHSVYIYSCIFNDSAPRLSLVVAMSVCMLYVYCMYVCRLLTMQYILKVFFHQPISRLYKCHEHHEQCSCKFLSVLGQSSQVFAF